MYLCKIKSHHKLQNCIKSSKLSLIPVSIYNHINWTHIKINISYE